MFRDGSYKWFEHGGQKYRVGVLQNQDAIKLAGVINGEPEDDKLSFELGDKEIDTLLKGQTVLNYATELPTEDIAGVTIFVAGTWTDSGGRKQKFTEADLDEMATNAQALGDKVKPHVKLMHLNPKDHLKVTAKPALGWVTNIRREGMKLVADFKKVPQKIAQLMQAGTFRRVSAEIFRRWRDESTGKVYKNVVSAVGLLGAVHPAVSTIDDVMKLFGMKAEDGLTLLPHEEDDWGECYGEEDRIAIGFYEAEFTEGDKHQKGSTEGGDSMDPKEVEKLKADIRADLKADFDKKLDQNLAEMEAPLREALGIDADADLLAAAKKKVLDEQKAVEELGERETKDFEAKVDEIILQAKKDGKIAPAQEHGIRLMIDGWIAQVDDTGKFELQLDDEEKVTGTVLENLAAYFEAVPTKHTYNQERGKLSKTNKSSMAPLPMSVRRELGAMEVPARVTGTNINEEVLAYQAEHKTDFMSAYSAVTGLTPPLAPEVGEYTINEATGEVHRT